MKALAPNPFFVALEMKLYLLYNPYILIYMEEYSLKKAYINPKKCDRSPFCPAKRICPEAAIIQDRIGLFGAGPAKVDQEKCIGCTKCVRVCPAAAISMV